MKGSPALICRTSDNLIVRTPGLAKRPNEYGAGNVEPDRAIVTRLIFRDRGCGTKATKLD